MDNTAYCRFVVVRWVNLDVFSNSMRVIMSAMSPKNPDQPEAATTSKAVRKPGRMKGKIWMSDDFDAADKEIERTFYESNFFPED